MYYSITYTDPTIPGTTSTYNSETLAEAFMKMGRLAAQFSGTVVASEFPEACDWTSSTVVTLYHEGRDPILHALAALRQVYS